MILYVVSKYIWMSSIKGKRVMDDHAVDEAGIIPEKLKRGVFPQDGMMKQETTKRKPNAWAERWPS